MVDRHKQCLCGSGSARLWRLPPSWALTVYESPRGVAVTLDDEQSGLWKTSVVLYVNMGCRSHQENNTLLKFT